MTRHQISARADNFAIGVIACACLVLLARAPVKDAADDQVARVHVAKQARVAAQPDTWARLDADGRRMTGYEGIGK